MIPSEPLRPLAIEDIPAAIELKGTGYKGATIPSADRLAHPTQASSISDRIQKFGITKCAERLRQLLAR
jgi:hypothetical protein